MGIVDNMIVQSQDSANSQRLLDIAKRWTYYYGDGPKALKVKPGQTDDNIRLNFAGRVVDEGVAFLFGQDVDFTVDGDKSLADGEANPADEWLEDVWDANNGMTLLNELGINGGVAGDAYLKVIAPKTEENPGDLPRLVTLDPASVSAVWKPTDYRTVLQWRIEQAGMDPATNRPKAFRQVITRADNGRSWQVVDQESEGSSRVWVTTGTATWPFAWAPVFHCQNLPAPNSFYGVSDLEDDVLEAGQGVNFTVSNTGRIIRFHAHPKTWGKGLGGGAIKVDVDGLINLNSKDGELHNLEMTSDLSSSLGFYDKLKQAFHEIARVPEIAAGNVKDIGQLSGLALKVLYGPLLRKNGVKRRLYGDMLRDLCQRLLEMNSMAGRRVTITWPDPLPTDPVQERSALESDQRMGVVSKDTIANKLGYDYATEKDRIAGEGQDLGDQLLTAFDRGGNNGG